ncbi:THUMP-like domain-containing protein [Maribacter sp. HTCC2170]|uniref:THUMP-like domain-containing protein n=1 Tax=Maribacter sp. (strain HTCC2170 / KCCM 42371) TaxID=313603 RepID=UPI00006B49BB|nr:hypothetical protein [Maribacter sp. HTCC2170]EAR01062.1 hypothetical protein FB2170_09831 [Maribacter sp. HTCC2170]
MSVLFKKPIFEHVTQKELTEQIEAKLKSQKKLPTWFNNKNIYYPNKLNIEQCSSEITAEYKSRIIKGKSLVDLTGGFGVDSYFFSKKIEQVFHCEINRNLSEIVTHNYAILGVENILTKTANGIDFLEQSNASFEWIYLDPSRRSESKGKVFLLSDCTPNIIEHLPLCFEKSKNILIKTSPLLDISNGLKQLKNVKEVHIVALNNEVKELLWVLQHDYLGEVRIHTINLKKELEERYDFNWSEEKNTSLSTEKPLNYLYEPNVAILKSGAFKLLSNDFKISKLHEHSHLYTSNKLIQFPGRTFKILEILKYHKKNLRGFSGAKANITCRNFPESVAQIRRKSKIKDGGDSFLFFTKDYKESKIVIVCKKQKQDS